MSEVVKEIERARKALLAAQMLLNESLFEDALSRSYYAVLHAAKAMLLCKGVLVASHEAVKRLFGLHLIKTGDVDLHLAEILRWEQDDRLLADYDVAFEPGLDLVTRRVEDARKFLDAADAFLVSHTS